MKLSTIHYQYMGEIHAKFHQNWWSGFRDIAFHDTEGQSFIIIRILIYTCIHIHILLSFYLTLHLYNQIGHMKYNANDINQNNFKFFDDSACRPECCLIRVCSAV